MKNNIENSSIIRNDYKSDLDGKMHYSCDITLPSKIIEGDRIIIFLSPLKLSIYCINSVDYGYPVAFFSYDFGMDHKTPLTSENNCILMGHDELSNEEKIIYDVCFDLFHAFFHPSVDPNYEDYHWALYGNLKDRVKCEKNENGYGD